MYSESCSIVYRKPPSERRPHTNITTQIFFVSQNLVDTYYRESSHLSGDIYELEEYVKIIASNLGKGRLERVPIHLKSIPTRNIPKCIITSPLGSKNQPWTKFTNIVRQEIEVDGAGTTPCFSEACRLLLWEQPLLDLIITQV